MSMTPIVTATTFSEINNIPVITPTAIANTLVPSASINAKRKASSEIEVAHAPVKKAKNKEETMSIDSVISNTVLRINKKIDHTFAYYISNSHSEW